jgi:hypothetical protein
MFHIRQIIKYALMGGVKDMIDAVLGGIFRGLLLFYPSPPDSTELVEMIIREFARLISRHCYVTLILGTET